MADFEGTLSGVTEKKNFAAEYLRLRFVIESGIRRPGVISSC